VKQLYPSYAPPEKWRNESQARRLEGEEWRAVRQRILRRDNYKCAYCGYRAEKFQVVDHIDGDPENNSDDNFQVICQMCNCVKHSGQGCVLKGIVELYRYSWFSQNSLIILTRFLRDLGKSDEEIKKLLGLEEQVPFEMDRQYLMPLFAFVTSRSTRKGDDMYDRWKDYHERVLRPWYGEKEIETTLQSIAPEQYRLLREQVKLKVVTYIPELADQQDKPITDLLIKAGVFKELRKKVRSNRHEISFAAVE
jgi:hypothetical protein